MNRPLLALLGSITLLLSACGGSDDTTPPDLAITTPASGSPVSGTVTVQVSANDDEGLSRVDLYARGRGAEGEGVFAGSAVESPFAIAWNTGSVPNLADLELVAVGKDGSGNESTSPPVAVRPQNSGVPALQLVTAFTIEPDPTVGASDVAGPSLPDLDAAVVQMPIAGPPSSTSLTASSSTHTLAASPLTPNASPLTPQAEGERDYILEWQWEPFASGADGYGVYLSIEDLAGPYEEQIRQAAGAGAGSQKFSTKLEGAKADSHFHGVVSAITDGASAESGYSNADSATFLPPQGATAPADGAQMSGGRPTLSWSTTPGAAGYLYYLFDKNPWEADATLLWSNFPQAESGQSATFPAERAALSSGTYHWWVAGVSFDRNGKADGFTFSEPRSFVVP